MFESKIYSDEQVRFLKELAVKENKAWGKIADAYNLKFSDNKSANSLRKTYNRYAELEFNDDTIISSMEEARKAKIENQKLRKKHNLIVDNHLTLENVLDQLLHGIKSGGFKPIFVPKYSADKTKKDMTIEILYSDLHPGKKSANFDLHVLEERIKEFSHTAMREIARNEQQYNVSHIIFAMLGDMIENSYFHGTESMSACEVENSEQIRIITELTYKYFIVPLARTGKKITIPCVCGNHDRWLTNPTYNNPGRNSIAYVIYTFLKFMATEAGLKNVTFVIPDGLYCTLEIYGRTILYEHGSEIKGRKEEEIEAFIHKRAKQIKKMIDFFRIGDKHSYTVYNKGRIIINGSLCGQDSYADSKGYSGVACQTMNFYINRKKGCIFYKSFPIDLENSEE